MKLQPGSFLFPILLMATLACVLPATQTASPATPTPDTRLDIMIAETVSAALTQTQQAAPVFDAATETPTSTPFPTSTIEVFATSTSSAESVLNFNEDGTTTFIDLRGKYQLTGPAQWLTMRINAPEFDTVSLKPEASNPAIQRSLNVIKNQDPNIFRLFLLDGNVEHIDGGFVTNINILWDQSLETPSLNQEEIKALANDLAQSLNGAEILATETRATKNGTPYGLISTRMPALTQDGVNVTVMQHLIFFDIPVGTLNITLSTTNTWLDAVTPSLDEMIESVIILK